MKKMKKFLCAALTSTMVLAMAAPSFAVEDVNSSIPSTSLTPPTTKPSTADTKGAIAIDNPVKKENGLATYTAYKIFDVTYTGGGEYAYSIQANSPWIEIFKAKEVGGAPEGMDDSEQSGFSVEGLSFVKAASSDVYYVTVDDSFNPAVFAQNLYGALEEMPVKPDGIVLQGTDSTVAATGLDLGYYFVTTTSGALCNLTTTNPNVVIHDKNEMPTIDKTAKVDEGSVQIGDVIPYTITGKVTNLEGYEEYIYEVTDSMSEGLTLLNSGINKIDVTLDGESLTLAREDLIVNENGFTLSLDLVELGAEFDDEIIINYWALVNEKAADGINPVTNTAKLKYSNDPATNGTGEATEQTVELYTSNLVIDKYRTGNDTYKLEGATFVLQNEENKYYQYTAANGDLPAEVHWVDDIKDATSKTTDDKGSATFTGLKDGTYYLVETEAPTGYNLLPERVEVMVTGIKSEVVEGDDGTMGATVGGYTLTTTQAIENSTGTILPGTGGIGTTIFYAAGIILMAGAVFFVVRRKRA